MMVVISERSKLSRKLHVGVGKVNRRTRPAGSTKNRFHFAEELARQPVENILKLPHGGEVGKEVLIHLSIYRSAAAKDDPQLK